MTDETPRCEPPPEWRGQGGWHHLEHHEPIMAYWACRIPQWVIGGNSFGVAELTHHGYRYLAPVTPPQTVAALVEALEGMMNLDTRQEVINEPPEADDIRAAAQQALALYRGEAGR